MCTASISGSASISFVVAVTPVHAQRITNAVQRVRVALADSHQLRIWVVLIDRNEFGAESETDETNSYVARFGIRHFHPSIHITHRTL